MSIPYNLLRVSVDTEAICKNFALLHHKGGNAIAVVKSDAYGHGLRHTATALAAAGCTRMAVGSVEEAVHLRSLGFSGQVFALLGAQDRDEDQACRSHGIVPFVCHPRQLQRLASDAGESPMPVCLKFDTGMRRLGFAEDELPALLQALERAPGLQVVMAASHLATADTPEEEAFVHRQAQIFTDICARLGRQLPPFERCLANSAAILAFPGLLLDAQRPGIAMYGANPFHGTGWEELGAGLRPAMQVAAPVLQVRDLTAGDSVSYGRTFRARAPMRIAIVAAGYADAYSRGLSSAARPAEGAPAMLVHGRRAPIVGRVCMQMTAVDVTGIPETRPGDVVHLLGGEGPQSIRVEELADWWGTISYEVFCLLGLNPRRE